MSSNKDFNIAAQGTDAQKERFESEHLDQRIKTVQTPEFRQSLQDLKFRTDLLVQTTKEQLEWQREKMAQSIIDRKVALQPAPDLRPDGTRSDSDWERRDAIRKFVDNKFIPKHKVQVEEKRNELYSALNAEVELTLKDEKELQKGRAAVSDDSAISEAKSKLAKMQENARDITQRLDRPRGPRRGRSR